MEMLESRIVALIKQVVAWLVASDFMEIEKRSNGVRLSADSMRAAVQHYGRTLAIPPESAYSELDSIRVTNADHPTWSIRFNLWTEEEGRSDLSVECTVIDRENGRLDIEIDDIHVL
jgi:hypothetical protein